MINTFLKLLVLVTLLSACSSSSTPTTYTPKGLTALSQDHVMEMAKNKSFPIPEKIVYKDPKGNVLSLDSLGKITAPNDYYQTYYKDENGTIKEVVIKKASAAEKAFNEKVVEVFNQ